MNSSKARAYTHTTIHTATDVLQLFIDETMTYDQWPSTQHPIETPSHEKIILVVEMKNVSFFFMCSIFFLCVCLALWNQI